MSDNIDLLYETKKKMLAKYPRFGSEVAASPVVFTNDVNTGATDGKNIYCTPQANFHSPFILIIKNLSICID